MRTAGIRQFGSLFLVLLFPGVPAMRAQAADVSWTFADDGSMAYRLENSTPGIVSLGSLGGENPTLPLEVGKRYQIQVVNHTACPFEVIAKGASAAQDKVLLSMDSTEGTFATDSRVKWQDDGQGTVQFTLTAHLFDAMTQGGLTPGYRCRTRADMMRGDFAVTWRPPLYERIAQAPIVIDFDRTTSGLVAPADLHQSSRLPVAAVRTRGIED
jgi:hypothetical protein